jgi:Restriction endonuclease
MVNSKRSGFAMGAAECVEWFVEQVLAASEYPVGVSQKYKVAYRPNATTGVLVTTSWFGRASEQFAQRNRITLINDAELKYLLKEHLALDVIPGTSPPSHSRPSDNAQTGTNDSTCTSNLTRCTMPLVKTTNPDSRLLTYCTGKCFRALWSMVGDSHLT